MWVTFIRSAFGLVVVAFLMWVTTLILGPLTDFATRGPHADHSTVVTISGWFDVLSLDNLTLIGGLAVGLYLLSRAVVERRATR